jgi:glycosyltransferase involved in cell wall biosynthesis
MRDGGVAVVPMEMARSVTLEDARVAIAIRSYVRSHGPFDVIHGHSSKGGAFARLASLGLPGVRLYTPNAFVTTDPRLSSAQRLFYAVIERLLIHTGHGLIAVSREEYEHARLLGWPRTGLFLVPNGTDVSPMMSRCEARRRFGLPEDAIIVGFVGRMVPQKDPETLVRAFLAARRASDRARLVIVGDGPLQEPARRLAETMGGNGHIHWLGVHDGPEVMPAFDLLALSSRYEGMPYVLIEGMTRSLPIVTTDVGGAGTLVEDGTNGFVVPRDRLDLFAAAMEQLISNEGLRERMGTASKARAPMFSASAMVDGVLTAYTATLAAAGSRGPSKDWDP